MAATALDHEPPKSPRAQAVDAFRHGNWKVALRLIDYALDIHPVDTALLNLRARAFEALGQFEEALRSVNRCLEADPGNVADLRNRALMLSKLGRREEALAAFDAVLAREPTHVDALIKRAFLLHQLDRRELALESAQRAVGLAPTNLRALNTRGMILETLCRYEEALADFEHVLALDPRFADGINNRGMIYARNGSFEEALQCYERSLTIEPNQPQARYNRAMVRLALGDWSRGFLEYESRWQVAPHEAERFKRLAPVWTGEQDIRGKTLLLHHEQGYGDSIQFVRYAALVQERGAQVIVAVPAGLHRLMETLPGAPRIVSEGDAIPAHDYCCPLMSLPRVFGTTPEAVPAQVPYLQPQSDQVRLWAQRLGVPSLPRIGLVWSGRRYAPINHPRDMSLETLIPLLDLPAEFICLQTEMAPGDRDRLATLPRIQCFTSALTDFSETAALIANLDLVIAVDTAVAHLAGAMAKPVWIMNRYASCWRWLQHRPDSPWYPTLRLFRQPSLGKWVPVVREVRAAAETWLADFKKEPCGARRVDPVPTRSPAAVAQALATALTAHHNERLPEAIVGYRKVLAIESRHPDALHFLGVALAQQGHFEAALAPLREALTLQPENAAAHNHYGNALAGQSRCEEALASYERALVLSPRFEDVFYNRGVALAKLERHEAALESYDQALAINPAYAAAHNNRGNLLLELDRPQEALVSYERAATINPSFVDAWVNRANVLRRLHRHDEALSCSAKALDCDPLHAEALSGRGAIFANLGRFDEALDCYRRSIELNPDLADGLWNKALLHLSRGQMKEGWPLYEARWRVKSLGLRHRFGTQPPWLGQESVQGKTVLLHAEQGYGDTIQFCRYAPLVKKLGARVLLGVPGALHTLMHTLEGVDEVIANGALPPYDMHCPLLSLPYAIGTDLASVPAADAYLRAAPQRRAYWLERPGASKNPRIGLIWAGKPTHTNDVNRSIALAELSTLGQFKAHWISLQRDVRETDRPVQAAFPELLSWGEEITDFADAAALISTLDLVISVDTAVAHLGGALGKPVWILLPFVADWRWLQEREDSPWYPSARLFRQDAPRDWRTVIRRVEEALPDLLGRRKRQHRHRAT